MVKGERTGKEKFKIAGKIYLAKRFTFDREPFTDKERKSLPKSYFTYFFFLNRHVELSDLIK